MKSSELPTATSEPTRRALQYWSEKWDWECPTLFGIELQELRAVLQALPLVPNGAEEVTRLAVVGSYRELLYGASAIPAVVVPETIGVTKEQACKLLEELAYFLGNLCKGKQ